MFGLGIHRGALFSLLHAEVVRLGIALTTATEIAGSRCTAEGRILIDRQHNEHGIFDLVVDATGVRSPLRAADAAIRRDRPYPYGAVWGSLAEPADWPHQDRLVQRYEGCHSMVGMLPIGRAPGGTGRLIALFWSLQVRDRARWQAAGLGPWKARVMEVCPAAEPLLAQIKSLDDMTFASYADMQLGRRRGPRIVFIGDAGRGLSPQLGQGANLALIDAATLADSLRQTTSIEAALAPIHDGATAPRQFLCAGEPLAHALLPVRQPLGCPLARRRLPADGPGTLPAPPNGAHPVGYENRAIYPRRSGQLASRLRPRAPRSVAVRLKGPAMRRCKLGTWRGRRPSRVCQDRRPG